MWNLSLTVELQGLIWIIFRVSFLVPILNDISRQARFFDCKIVIIILTISLNMRFGCSKESSHWDISFEYPKHMFWLRNFQICTLIISGGLFLGITKMLYERGDLYITSIWVKVFRINPLFRILRLTFHRKSASKSWIKEIIIASLISKLFRLTKHNHFSFKLSIFVAILQVLKFEFQKFWIL